MSYYRFVSFQIKEKLLTIFENSKYEVLILSFDTKSFNKVKLEFDCHLEKIKIKKNLSNGLESNGIAPSKIKLIIEVKSYGEVYIDCRGSFAMRLIVAKAPSIAATNDSGQIQ